MAYTRPGMVGPASGGGSFQEKTAELAKLVGKGQVSAEVKVSQVYARRQHQNPQYAHPRGGEAFYLRNALNATHREHLQRVALEVFRGNVQSLFIQFGEKLASEARDRTPIELGNLRDSGSVTVKAQGRVIYRRPAKQAKMTRRQLNSRVRLHHLSRNARRLGGG